MIIVVLNQGMAEKHFTVNEMKLTSQGVWIIYDGYIQGMKGIRDVLFMAL